MLPEMDGLSLTRWLRDRSNMPIILLTARRAEADRIAGLEMGADDYVVKPFSPQELVSRVRAVLRRTGREQGEPPPTQKLDVRRSRSSIRPDAWSPWRAGRSRSPPANSTCCFCWPSTRVRSSPVTSCWSESGASAITSIPGTVTVHVRRLREKLEKDPSSPQSHPHGLGCGLQVRAMKSFFAGLPVFLRYVLGVLLIVAVSLGIFKVLMSPAARHAGADGHVPCHHSHRLQPGRLCRLPPGLADSLAHFALDSCWPAMHSPAS